MVAAGQRHEPPPEPAVVKIDGLEALLLQAADGLQHFVDNHPLIQRELADLEPTRFGPVGGVPWKRHLAVWSRLGDVEPGFLPFVCRLGGSIRSKNDAFDFSGNVRPPAASIGPPDS